MKKTIASIMAAACLLTSTVALTGCKNAEAQNETVTVTELKVGRYYLNGGTEEEYIEVYDDKTIQMFGFDYYEEVCKLNASLLEEKRADGDEVWLAEFEAMGKEDADFWFSRHYYVLSPNTCTIGFSETPPVEGQTEEVGGWVLFYNDENTIEFNDTHIYKFAE